MDTPTVNRIRITGSDAWVIAARLAPEVDFSENPLTIGDEEAVLELNTITADEVQDILDRR